MGLIHNTKIANKISQKTTKIGPIVSLVPDVSGLRTYEKKMNPVFRITAAFLTKLIPIASKAHFRGDFSVSLVPRVSF